MRPISFQFQQGVALFVSLIFLLLLTIIGVVAMQNATLQEKMAGNSKFKNESLQYAEAGLREGEGIIASETYSAAIDACDACSGNGCRVPDWGAITVSSDTCDVWRQSTDNNSYFYIQKLGQSTAAMNVVAGESVTLFRVTSVATVGGATTALESIYAKN